MELWERIKEYDRNAAEEASVTPVLTRKQKQNLKTQFLDGKQPNVEIMNDTTIQPVRVTPAQYCEVQISTNVQSDLDLWARIREYDQRTAEKGFTQVLSKKQQQAKKKKCWEYRRITPVQRGGTSPSAQ